MTTSGEHDSDPYNFVEIAMKKILGGKGGLTLLGIYYFLNFVTPTLRWTSVTR